MSLNDPLANALSHILNCERKGKSECIIKNASKLIKQVLTLLKERNYVGEFKNTKTNQGEYITLALLGAVNKCGAIKPRFAVKKDDYMKFEKRYLPARGFGLLIVSTNKGIIAHQEAIEKKLGGRLIAYCY